MMPSESYHAELSAAVALSDACPTLFFLRTQPEYSGHRAEAFLNRTFTMAY